MQRCFCSLVLFKDDTSSFRVAWYKCDALKAFLCNLSSVFATLSAAHFTGQEAEVMRALLLQTSECSCRLQRLDKVQL